jgi:hypothetical protein
MTIAEKVNQSVNGTLFTVHKEFFYKCYNEDAMVFVQKVRKYKVSSKFVKLTALLLLAISCGSLNAQTSVAATGGDASGSGGSASYTVGQVVYTTATGTTGSVAQGVQQPYEISITVGVEEKTIGLVAFPNPTKDQLNLSVAGFTNQQYIYQLYDASGKLVKSDKVSSSTTSINTQALTPGIYLLSVLDNNSIIKTFRIIKN